VKLLTRGRDLPLFWKILLPFLALLLVVGALGTFGLVRNLADRAQASLDNELAQRSLAARSFVHDRELYLLESANLAANLQGMADAVRGHDGEAAARLLTSVLALKTDAVLVAVTDRTGAALAQFSRMEAGAPPVQDPPSPWGESAVAAPALAAPGGATSAGFLGFGDRPLVTLATTICSGSTSCDPVGVAIVAVDARELVASAGKSSIALFDATGRFVAGSGRSGMAPSGDDGAFVRRRHTVGGASIETLYAPLTLQGQRAGTLAVSLPTAPAFDSVRSAAWRLGLLLLAVMAGIVGIGAALSRFVLGQVRRLVETNRALAGGDLSARAPVLGNDELGELAAGVNQMAGALQEAYANLETRVEERTADVQRLLRERTDFFTAVSHEFRTPLAVILGQAQMLADPKVAKNPRWHAQTGQILTDAGSQLLAFVNDILEIARAESGHIEISPTDIRLASVVEALEPTLDSMARAAGVDLSVRIPSRLPRVHADEVRVREILVNLVDNAMKYTPAGGSVEISAKAADDVVSVSVSDTGVGIPEDAHAHLFEPFYRVPGIHTQSGQPSSGLGLALVHSLLKAQGGDITVASAPREGSVFTFTLASASGNRELVSASR